MMITSSAKPDIFGDLKPGEALGLVAGNGDLPLNLIQILKGQGHPLFVVALKGSAQADILEKAPGVWLDLGQAKALIAYMQDQGLTKLVMAGGVARPHLLWPRNGRPAIWQLKPDSLALSFALRYLRARRGDDSLLVAVKAVLREQGLQIIGLENLALDAVLQGLQAAPGPLSKKGLNKAQEQDLYCGIRAAKSHGLADKGQAVVVKNGTVLAHETIAGTDALIRSVGHKGLGEGAMLVKAVKPQQDRSLDLPCLGLETLKQAKAAGFSAVTFEADGALLLDAAACQAFANAESLCLYAFSADEVQHANAAIKGLSA